MGLRSWLTQIAGLSSPENQFASPRDVSAPTLNNPSSLQAANSYPQDFGIPGRWIPPGQPIQLHGLTIPGGMLYVGEKMPSVDGVRGWGNDNDPALVDPSLSVDFRRSDRLAEFGYWPSYHDIGASARAAYLQWLAEGRRSIKAPISLVFLFFYGLERRCLSGELDPTTDRLELDAISQEIQSLLDVYGDQGSFRAYASSLLEVVGLLQNVGKGAIGTPPPISDRSWQLPTSIRYAMAMLSARAEPVTADWAFAWLYFSPDSRFRTPSQRCADEFRTLWTLRYKQKYGTGLIIKPNKTRLSIKYHAASSGFSGSQIIPVADLPDVATLKGPINKLVALASSCEDELDAYSRYLGKNPSGRESLEAIALLPKELVESSTSNDVVQLIEWVEGLTQGKRFAVVEADELATRWSAGSTKLGKPQSLSLAQLLSKYELGIEPDVRFGGKPVGGNSVVIFELPEHPPVVATANYQACAVLLHLATAVALADGSFSEAEQAQLTMHLESGMELTSSERIRLAAYVKALQLNGAPLTGLGKRVDDIDASDRRKLGHFLVAVAAADGSIRPAEIDTLTKIYALLKIEDGAVFTDIHSLTGQTGTAASTPVTVRRGTSRRDFAIPERPPVAPAPESQAIELDMEVINSTLEESARVSALLGNIFSDDQTVTEPPPVIHDERAIDGLDVAHSTFLRALASKNAWTRSEVESLASAQNILPDGALDTINEFAFENCGDPVWVGTDTVEIDTEILKELLA